MRKTTMALIVLTLLCSSFTAPWRTNFEEAKAKAQQEHKYLLLNFSGSDWCGPCIRMREEIFGADVFGRFADSALVLVNADFPRQKKNQLPKALQQQNNQLAERYNPAGRFPYTVLLDTAGHVVKSWDGYPREKAEAFIEEIKQYLHDNR